MCLHCAYFARVLAVSTGQRAGHMVMSTTTCCLSSCHCLLQHIYCSDLWHKVMPQQDVTATAGKMRVAPSMRQMPRRQLHSSRLDLLCTYKERRPGRGEERESEGIISSKTYLCFSLSSFSFLWLLYAETHMQVVWPYGAVRCSFAAFEVVEVLCRLDA